MKKILLSLILLATCVTMHAAKAANFRREVTLQDGRTVTIHLVGDENVHYLCTENGEVIKKDDAGYRVATQAEIDELNNAIMQYSQAQAQAQAKAITALKADKNEGIYGYQLFPHTGKQKVLVLMAEFADLKFTYTKNDIDSILNSSAKTKMRNTNSKSYTSGTETIITRNSLYYSYSSAREYFKASSDGQFEPEFDVYGPYTLPNNMTYYGTGHNDRMDLFVPAVCSLADNDVDFSEYDQDNDGFVDLVYIFYAGYGANVTGDERQIWAKCSYMLNPFTRDGKTVYRFGVNAELLANEDVINKKTGLPYINGIGVFCHEFSHAMGLPDFYPTVTWYVYNNGTPTYDFSKFDNQSMEDWDLMDNGLNSGLTNWPPLYTAFERELMGWTKIDTLSKPADVTMKPLLHGGKAYKILNDNDPTGNEYWILEALSADSLTETWHQHLCGRGLLVTHVNYNPNTFISFDASGVVNKVNNTAGSPGITVLTADGYLPSSYHTLLTDESSSDFMTPAQFLTHESGDPYPGSQNVTEITDYKPYTGTVDKPITDIAMADDFTVTFKFMGGTTAIQEVRAFDNNNKDTYYTLDGRALNGQPTAAGIYIKGGKKIVIK
ncbi:MAG: M6 family metalloprotease domain-containing protein [Prevotella sp.]|nr:M6 family metalloprotease domain-containing protein [Prevotella sp.]MBO5641723.1 M6 family metalloprotease domain-containing protein [Prevotella sp.]